MRSRVSLEATRLFIAARETWHNKKQLWRRDDVVCVELDWLLVLIQSNCLTGFETDTAFRAFIQQHNSREMRKQFLNVADKNMKMNT